MAIVFFDLDRTTWDDNMNTPESTITAIQKLHQNGHSAFICTGRARANVPDEEILRIGFDGIVCACGNYIEKDGKVLYNHLLDKELNAKAIKVFKKYKLPVVFEGPKYHWFNPEDFRSYNFMKMLWDRMGDKAKPYQDFKPEYEVNKYTVDIMPASDYEGAIEELQPYMSFIMHENTAIEFIPKGTSKAVGIRKTCKLLNIPHEETYALGDGPNDVDMLKDAAHGICMGNGVTVAKAVADYITTSIENDGVYNAMKHYNLI